MTQTPGPLEKAYKQRSIARNSTPASEALRETGLIWRHLDSLSAPAAKPAEQEPMVSILRKLGYTVIPPEGEVSFPSLVVSEPAATIKDSLMVGAKTEDAPDFRKLFYSLIGSLGLADHLGDVAGDVSYALKLAGTPWPDGVGTLEDVSTWLGETYGVKTLYDTELTGD